MPSSQVIGLQLLMLSVALVNELIVKFSVITESHPAALVKVKVGELVEEEYVTPLIQVNGPQLCCTSLEALGCSKVKFSVITESHPAALVKVKVGVLVEVEYVTPSIQVNGPQLCCTSVEALG